MSRPRLIIWGLFAIVILWLMGLQWKPVEIQDDLLQRSSEKLAMNGHHDVAISFDGRDAYVDPKTPDLDRVSELVSSVHGVRVVNDQRRNVVNTDVAKNSLPLPSFELEIKDGIAIASGSLGEEFRASELEKILKERFGEENVRLELDLETEVEPLSGLDTFTSLVDSIAGHVLNPSISLMGTEDRQMSISISGDLRNRSDESALMSNLRSLSDSSWEIKSDFESGAAQRGLNALILAEKVAFLPGRAELLSSSRNLLNAIADSLNIYSQVQISVDGHTDAFGDADSNLLLSLNRANAVVDYLIGRGVDRSRLEAQGFGETIPIAPNNNTVGRRQNRRVEFHVR